MVLTTQWDKSNTCPVCPTANIQALAFTPDATP